MKTLHIPISLFLPSLFLLSCFLSLVLSLSPSQTHFQHQCLDDQRSALLQLHRDLYYAPNFTFSSQFELWDLNTDCCSWKGITCDALGQVIGVDLGYQNLSGTFHSIFNLSHLQLLNVAGNNLNSTLFQYEFDKLSNLTHLNLSNSCFHGQIPVEISYLTSLVSLDLSNQDSCLIRYYNQIFDPVEEFLYSIPLLYELEPLKLEIPNFKTLIKNLRPLAELYLDGVNISTQSTKWCETVSIILPNLRVLSLSNCGLTGPFCSSLSRLPFLSKLFLGGNPISYFPPNFLEISSRLVSLSLRNCNLSGHFPIEILSLPKMQSIDISDNDHLMGQLPKFPLNSTLGSLWLSNTNFSGELPESIGNLKFLTNLNLYNSYFSGKIPSSIANLTNIVELDLGFNYFSGFIPPFHIVGVPNLSRLYLDGNQLSGTVHSTLFVLPSLEALILRQNQLVGEIVEFPNVSSSLLNYLSLEYNNLRGSIPKSILQLPRLKWLYIGHNSFSSIERNNRSLSFPQLESLSLSSCNLTEFPEFIKTQEKLKYLDLSNNQIHGFVPNWLWKATLLRLNLAFNAIEFPKDFPFGDAIKLLSFPLLRRLSLQSCNLSTFPPILKSLKNLEYLDLSNNRISGTIPNWVWKKSLEYVDLFNNSLSSLDQFSLNHSSTSSHACLSTSICNLTQLYYFNASYNKLSGPIPRCLGNISTLQSLDLQNNNFTGSILDFAKATELYTLQLNDNKLEGKLPRSLANCRMLTILNLGNNTLYDTFPLWLGKLPELIVLVLRGNRFYGPIRVVKNNFPWLDVLDIASNNFSGQLPIEFFQAPLLRSIKMGENQLEGKLPRLLAHCTYLEVLDLGNNMVHDTFPLWLGKLPFLKVLVLRENRFYGSIKFSEDGNAFPMIRILDLASNNFSGELSGQFFQHLRSMMMTDENEANPKYIGDSYYQDSVTIVNKGLVMVFEKILTTFTCLDLANNSFHGRIPEEIQCLTAVRGLNLSYNSFSGPIPIGLGNLNELESLDLSCNNLSGEIPQQLTSLTFLAVLDLSYNQLEGNIPQSFQFGTFSNNSYRGNPGLCGMPLTRKCNEAEVPVPPPGDNADSWVDGISVWKMVLIGYGCGLVIGLFLGYTVLNEMGNKWLHSCKRNGNRNRTRS